MSNAIMATKITFKKAEAEWCNYHNTLKEIAKLREEIMNPFVDEPDDAGVVQGANSVRIPGDPTGRMATRLTTSRQLSYLTEIVEAIEQVYEALPESHKKLARLRYWNTNNKLTWDIIAGEIHVSRRQAIYWRDEIIQATMEVLGWR